MQKHSLTYFITNLIFDLIVISLLLFISLDENYTNSVDILGNISILASIIPLFSLFYFKDKISTDKRFFNIITGGYFIQSILLYLAVINYSYWFIIVIVVHVLLTLLKRAFIKAVTFDAREISRKRLSNQCYYLLIIFVGLLISLTTRNITIPLVVTVILVGILLFIYIYKRSVMINNQLFLYGMVGALSTFLISYCLYLDNLYKLLAYLPILISAWLIDKAIEMF